MLALIFPYRNRPKYLWYTIKHTHQYLVANNYDHVIIIAEQTNFDEPFSLSRANNIGAAYALRHYPDLTHLAIQHCDIIPAQNVSYRSNVATVWFLDAGGLLITPNDFVTINGYNNDFYGWGYEDSEIWIRLDTFGIPRLTWQYSRDCIGAVMVNLECTSRNESEITDYSKHYWGTEHPRFITKGQFERQPEPWVTDVYDRGDWLNEKLRQRNIKLAEAVKAMQLEARLRYFQSNGLNRVSLDRVTINDSSANIRMHAPGARIHHLCYRSKERLK